MKTVSKKQFVKALSNNQVNVIKRADINTAVQFVLGYNNESGFCLDAKHHFVVRFNLKY